MIVEFPRWKHHERYWDYFWIRYVTGFYPERHCLKCLLGYKSDAVIHLKSGAERIELNECPDPEHYVYICGGAVSRRWRDNLHITLRPKAGEAFRLRSEFSGQVFAVTDAEFMKIPGLPDNFNAKDRSYTTCRNYCFGVEYFQKRMDSNPDGTYGKCPR